MLTHTIKFIKVEIPYCIKRPLLVKEWPLLFSATALKITQQYGEIIAKIRYNTFNKSRTNCSKLYVGRSLVCEFFCSEIKNKITIKNWEKI